MEIADVKQIIDTYRVAGKSREETIEVISALPVNGERHEIFEYCDLVYKTTPSIIGTLNYTDAGNGEAIASRWQYVIHYVFEWKAWIVYQGGRWVPDTTGSIRKLAVETMRQLYTESINIEDLEERKKSAQWYITSESDKRITAALNYAISQPGISITADQLDNKPWLLNVKNGTLDLQTVGLRVPDPKDLLTQQIDIDYNPDATAEEWEAFLMTIFNNDIEVINYLQRGIGYTLNGTQLERVFFFLFGLGRNGKSQLMDALRRVLGPYALEAKPELFMETKYSNSGPNEEQAAMKGKRLLTATEIKRGQNLDVSLVKRMTGSEPIWHERKFMRGYSFNPTHTLWLSGNHEPSIKDTTDSLWDRLNKIPFDVRIPVEKEIKGYGEKLATAHGEAILNWCVKGATAWKERGLTNPPECVLMANTEYRERQDALHDFLEMRVDSAAGEIVTLQDMFKEYTDFCQQDDSEPMGKNLSMMPCGSVASKIKGATEINLYGLGLLWLLMIPLISIILSLRARVRKLF